MKSMTGYGSAEGRVGKGTLFAEVRGVNSRFLDINCKIPPSMYVVESKIRKLAQDNIVRGKVDIFIKEKASIADSLELSVNEALVKQYKNCLNRITGMLGLKASSHLLEVVDLKELVVFRDTGVDMSRMWQQIEKIISGAILKFDSMRKKEGEALKRDQLKRIAELERVVGAIKKRAKIKVFECREKMKGCLEAEMAALLDRIDVTEELTRLESHIGQYRGLVGKNGVVGRQLDFLIQEMHREINTLGSKANDADVSGHVVEAKTEIEKLREQVQNVE